jgi:hypothetical protein
LTLTRATYWWSWKALTPATVGVSIRELPICSSLATSRQ